jgi:DNA-binding CsgD family transcriptional regulator
MPALEHANASLPLGQAKHRNMPAVLIVDQQNLIALVNSRAVKMLRDICGAEIDVQRAALPPVLAALVPELRAKLRERMDTAAAALLTVDICARACLLGGDAGQHVMLLFERVQRKDAVQSNLERYALTPRECDVVNCVLYGCSNRRIADQLFLAEHTVEDHLKRIFIKLGVRTRTALAAKILGWRESNLAG